MDFFFTRKYFVKFLPILKFETSKFYKRIPYNFDLGLFYKEFTWEKNLTGKSFVKFFPTSKLKIEFHSHKQVVSP